MLNSHAASQEDLDAGIGSFDYNELIDAQANINLILDTSIL